MSSMVSQEISLPDIDIRDGHRPISPSAHESPPITIRAAAPAPFVFMKEAVPPAAHDASPADASPKRILPLM